MATMTAGEEALAWLLKQEEQGLIEWVPDPFWTTNPQIIGRKFCRQKGCRRPAVAAARRSHGRYSVQWWAYCDNPGHLYGRRIVGGVVLDWHLIV